MPFPAIGSTLPSDTFFFERRVWACGLTRVAGCDEAGRGPLAGPVVAASVILPADCDYLSFRDSKILSPKARLELRERLVAIGAEIGVGIVSAADIDRLNILQASLLVMRLAVEQLSTRPDHLLVDGKFAVPLLLPQETLIKGESKSASIAAASIVAKVVRDSIMDDLHQQFPQYDFARHKGYPTKAHRLAIAAHGPCPIHRRSFRGVKEHER